MIVKQFYLTRCMVFIFILFFGNRNVRFPLQTLTLFSCIDIFDQSTIIYRIKERSLDHNDNVQLFIIQSLYYIDPEPCD